MTTPLTAFTSSCSRLASPSGELASAMSGLNPDLDANEIPSVDRCV
jgi:hypothetical protein